MQLKIVKCSNPTLCYSKDVGNIYDYDVQLKPSDTINVKVVKDKNVVWKQVLKKDVEFIK